MKISPAFLRFVLAGNLGLGALLAPSRAEDPLYQMPTNSVETRWYMDATLGDQHDANMLYFHSYWRRENSNILRQDMTILPHVEGKGRFLGCNLGTENAFAR